MRTSGALFLFFCAAAPAVHASGSMAARADCDPSGRAVVRTNLLGAMASLKEGAPLDVLVMSFKGSHARVDFMRDGKPYALHLEQGANVAMILDQAGKTLPVPVRDLRMRYSADDLCADFGMMARCQRLTDSVVAGRAARHWVYSSAAHRGPFASSKGEVWLDAKTGLLLRYSGASRAVQFWDVSELHLESMADERFLRATNTRSAAKAFNACAFQ